MPSHFMRPVIVPAPKCVSDRPKRDISFLAYMSGWISAMRTAMYWLKFCWLLLLGSFLFGTTAHAQTAVSGAIAVNTHWSPANAPYVINGTVVVQNGAMLTIDAGVTVYMAADASLTVQGGGIQALGSVDQPIKVLSEKIRLGQAAAPGDWNQWVFNPGTVNTKLDHVLIEHGKGIVVKGAAPVFNFLNVRHHQGAAITIDLAASPTGVGNQASGNVVNGVAVPPGDINGNIKWGLRGIPYVVSSGTVSVGLSPKVLTVTPETIQQGETVTVNITGSRLSGLSEVSFDKAGVSAQVLAGATDTQASLSVTADADAPVGSAMMRLLANAGEVRVANALTLMQAQPTLHSLAPSTLYVGQGNVSVNFEGHHFTEQTVVLINDAPVGTQFLSPTQIRADVVVPSTAGDLRVRLRTPDPQHSGEYLSSNELILPVAAAQITITPSPVSVARGTAKTFTVTLPYPAPTGGVNLSLVSSVPTVATVPSPVMVSEGQSAADFQLAATDLGSTVVTASRVGFVSGQAQVTVIPPPNLSLTPASLTLGVGRTAELTITSSVPATGNGLLVTLTSSDTAFATVPESITIPSGANSATVPVSTTAIGSATITAQAAEFVNGTAAVTVRPVSLNMPASALVAPGLSRSIPITLSDPAPEGGLQITLASTNPAIATAPETVTVPVGQSVVNFTLTGVAAGETSISATANGYETANLPTIVEAVAIRFGNPVVNSVSMPVDIEETLAVTLSRPAPPGGVVIDLDVGDASTAVVSPSSITIEEGQTSGGIVLAHVSGVVTGTTTLSANAPGLTPASIPITVTGKAELVFSTSSVIVGKGLQTHSSLRIYRRTDGNNYSPDQALTVHLTSGDPSKVTVPATITIPAGWSNATVYITGVDFTDGTPVTIDATATGYTAPATKLAANVVAPVFNFSGLESNRSPGSTRDSFHVYVTVPGATNWGGAAADMPISLGIVGADPVNIIDGFYSAQSGGTAVTQVMLPQGNVAISTVFVGTPTNVGRYQVQAVANGIASATSDEITVAAPELQFSKTSVTVGKGFRTHSSEVRIQRAINGVTFYGTEALTVNLTSSDTTKAQVPATVTIPANSSSATVFVTGVDLTDGTPVTIDATAAGYTAPATKLAANVRAPVFNFSGLESKRSPASARDNFSVYVTVPGATYLGDQTAVADIPISLETVEADPANIIDGFYSAQSGGTAVTQVMLRQGNKSSDTVYVGTPTAVGSYKVHAAITGFGSRTSGVITVTAPELKFSKSAVIVGKGLRTYSSEVLIQRISNGTFFAGAEALTINLISSDATKVQVPATVTIPANSSNAIVVVTGVDFTDGTPVTIDATATGYVAPATKLAANVREPTFNFSGLDSNRSPASTRDGFWVYATVPGAAYPNSQTAAADMPINLTTVEADPTNIIDGFYSAQSGGTVVTQVMLRQGYGTSDTVYVGTPTATGSYKVQVAATGIGSSTSDAITVTAPELKFSKSAVTVGKGLNTYSGEVYVYRAANGTSFAGTEDLTVNLACSSTAICKVPASVTIPAGQSSINFTIEGVDAGNTTVTASAVGYTATQDLAVNVINPQLSFSGPNNTSVDGQSNFTVRLNVPGASYPAYQTAVSPITVNLTSSAPGVATVPPTTVIQSGNTSSATAKLTGVAAGTTTLTASGPGLSSATTGVITINP